MAFADKRADHLIVTQTRKTTTRAEFGDFQTPASLAQRVTELLNRLGILPRSIIEPTCGKGAFIEAAATAFVKAKRIVGVDINAEYLNLARERVGSNDRNVEFLHGDFFKMDWLDLVNPGGAPWLILGNPPWVTSAELGVLQSANLPEKSNFQARKGIDAITGKSNFDISEWMLLRYLDWLEGQDGAIAVLCKTAVARKILLHVWKTGISVSSARIFNIDASLHFGASVDACLFVLEIQQGVSSRECEIYEAIEADEPGKRIGFLDGHIVSDAVAFNHHRELLGPEENYVWRSGVKHDCSKVMELKRRDHVYENGFAETVSLEDAVLYPMLKSSDIGNGRVTCRGAMLVTQRYVGEDTEYLRQQAPNTWEYLAKHQALLDKRGSSIYRNKPRYSIFGVGAYTFSPWKIAISGFYKNLNFVKVGPVNGRPVVLDDTIYFLSCWTEEEADFIEFLLSSQPAQAFYRSMVHWDEKRPITVDILKRLSIEKLAARLGKQSEYDKFARPERRAREGARGVAVPKTEGLFPLAT